MDQTESPSASAESRRPGPAHDWRSQLLAELAERGVARPFGPAVMTVGWVHLAFFLVCQGVYTAGVRAPWVSLLLWGAELAAVLLAMLWVAGPRWLLESSAVGLIARVWITFLILSFNVASLNSLTGWTLDWFKPVWCTLSSFGFATMAWLFGARLLIPAFQMYFTGLMMVRYPEWNYAIYGASWWIATQYIGMDLVRRRARILEARAEPTAATRPLHEPVQPTVAA